MHRRNTPPTYPRLQAVRVRFQSRAGSSVADIFPVGLSGQSEPGPGLHFARDFCSPLSAVGRDLIGDPRTLRTPKLPTFRKKCGDETQESYCTSAENEGKPLRLTLVGALVDKDAGGPLGPSRPQITFPSSHTDKAQIVEIDIAVMTGPDVPEKHRLAEAVVRGLREGAGA